MKNDLTCGVVRDLLPSYADGIAGEETAAAVERHMAECEECRAALHRMKEPEDAAPPEEKEIDYLKKVRRRGRRKVTAVLAAAALLAMAVTLGVLYKGVPAEPGAIAAVVTVRDGSVRVTGALTDSGRALSRAHITQDESGAVEVRINVTPLPIAHSGDFTLEHPAAREVTSVSVNGLILWENGKAIDWIAARLYEAKNPYVGDMSANAHIASEPASAASQTNCRRMPSLTAGRFSLTPRSRRRTRRISGTKCKSARVCSWQRSIISVQSHGSMRPKRGRRPSPSRPRMPQNWRERISRPVPPPPRNCRIS